MAGVRKWVLKTMPSAPWAMKVSGVGGVVEGDSGAVRWVGEADGVEVGMGAG